MSAINSTRRTSRQEIQNILSQIAQVINDDPPSPKDEKEKSSYPSSSTDSTTTSTTASAARRYGGLSDDILRDRNRIGPDHDDVLGSKKLPAVTTTSDRLRGGLGSREVDRDFLDREREYERRGVNVNGFKDGPPSPKLGLSSRQDNWDRDAYSNNAPRRPVMRDDDIGIGRLAIEGPGRSSNNIGDGNDKEALKDLRTQHIRNLVNSHEKERSSDYPPSRFDRENIQPSRRDMDPAARTFDSLSRHDPRDNWRGNDDWRNDPRDRDYNPRDIDYDPRDRDYNPRYQALPLPPAGPPQASRGGWNDMRDGWSGDPRAMNDDGWDNNNNDGRMRYNNRRYDGPPPNPGWKGNNNNYYNGVDQWENNMDFREDEEVVHTDVVLPSMDDGGDYMDVPVEEEPFYDGIDEDDEEYGFMMATANDLNEARVAYFHGILNEVQSDDISQQQQRQMMGPYPPQMRMGRMRGGPAPPPGAAGMMYPNGNGNNGMYPPPPGEMGAEGIVAGQGLAMPAWLDQMQPPAMPFNNGGENGPVPLLAGKPHPMARFMVNGQITIASMPPNLGVVPVAIMEHVFLGDYHASANKDALLGLGIKAVINCTTEIACHYPQVFKYFRIGVDDLPTANIKLYFRQALHFIDTAREHGDNVLIHCLAGRARSATIVIMFLIARMRMSLRQAFEHTRAKKSDIRPNYGFWNQLIAFEKEIYGRNSLRMEQGRVVPVQQPPPQGR